MQDVKEAIAKSQALQPFRTSCRWTSRPRACASRSWTRKTARCSTAAARASKPYTTAILREVTSYLRTVPNRLSVTGHTDTLRTRASPATRLGSIHRARQCRAPHDGQAGLPTERVSRVVGLASSVLFDQANPRGAVNRRISIVVLTQQAEQVPTRPICRPRNARRRIREPRHPPDVG